MKRFLRPLIATLAWSVVAIAPALAGPPQTEADREWSAVQTCQFAIMAQLPGGPLSASFPDVSRSYRKLEKGVYTTQVMVRGKNAYNATVSETFECKIDAKTMLLKTIKRVQA